MFNKFGIGIYSNEENYDCNSCKQYNGYGNAFWGNNYDRLLQIKQDYDPEQVFWCNHCVGDS